MQTLENLLTRLEYQFNNPGLLNTALSHRSVEGANYERLEFLGDSIVNFVIAEALYFKFPSAQEGELSRLRAYFVKEESLAEVARELELGSFLRLGSGELKSGGRDRTSILADVLEAVIGALYLDAGLEVCKQKILHWFSHRLETTSYKKSLKDPKTRLQEWVQGKGLQLPVYEIIKVEGLAHQQVFTVSCSLAELGYHSEAIDSTRRKAEQEAANKILTQIENDQHV